MARERSEAQKKVEVELTAMRRVLSVFQELEQPVRGRVMAWVQDQLRSKELVDLGIVRQEPLDPPGAPTSAAS